MKVLITSKKSKNYGFVVDVITKDLDYVKFISPVTGRRMLLNSNSCTELFNSEPRVGDAVIGLASASKEYYHTQEGFIGAILAVDDRETLEVRGFSTADPELKLGAIVDTKHFELRHVHPANMAVALGQVVKGEAEIDIDFWNALGGQAIPMPVPAPMPVAPPAKPKPAKPTKAGGFGAKDNVKLSPKSNFNDGSPNNPVDILGVVDAIVKGQLPVRVKWSNGFLNSYTPKDLIKG